MQLIRHLKHHFTQPCVLTIGNFDGLHLGHQALLTKLKQLSTQYQLPSAVMSFSPSPSAFFGKPKAQINNLKQQYQQLEAQGINKYFLLPFNELLANLSAVDFVRELLVKQLNITHILIGDDFVFGKNRLGNKALLQTLGQQHQFHIHQLDSIQNNKQRISSSSVRKALAVGDFQTSKTLLGREFSISGKIIHGNKQGRTIGFPTLNIPIKRKISPVLGVFAVEILLANKTYQGVANVGHRPTINGKKTQLEVFIFNFEQDVYGQIVSVIFKKKIRDEQKFTNLEALKKQIQTDVKAVKHHFELC